MHIFEIKLKNNIMGGLGIIWSIIVGLLAGVIAGKIMKGKGFGFIMNVIIGLVGGVIGGWAYSLLGISSSGGIWGNLVMATIGAIILLFIVSLFKKK